MFKSLTILTVFSIGVFNALSGQVASEILLNELLRLTIENNPEVVAFERKYKAAQQRVPQISSLPDPKLQYSEFIESVQTRTGSQERVLSLNQGFPWFGSLNLKEEQASHEAKAIWYAYQSKILEVTRKVADLYFEIGFTEKAIELTKENLTLLKDLEPIIEDKFLCSVESPQIV